MNAIVFHYSTVGFFSVSSIIVQTIIIYILKLFWKRVWRLLCTFEIHWLFSYIGGSLLFYVPDMKSRLVGNKLLIFKNLKIIKCGIRYSAFYFVYNIPYVRNLTTLLAEKHFLHQLLSKGIYIYMYILYYCFVNKAVVLTVCKIILK